MCARPMPPERYFQRHGLSTHGLQPAAGGLVNQVWMTDDAVLRVGSRACHAREAQVACAALAAGVLTAHPLFWGRHYSLWQRLPGHHPNPVTPELWEAVLHDLEKLHAHPPLPRPRQTLTWTGEADLVAATQLLARWNPAERQDLEAVLTTPYPMSCPVFIHGDAYPPNILVNREGRYAGLIDWGNARWATLEHEAAPIQDLDIIRERWGERMDWRLFWRVRLNLLLLVARYGRVPIKVAREAFEELKRLEGAAEP